MSHRTRQNITDQLRQNAEPDVLIVGGGINGIGLYRELALQGVNVVMVEKNDFCSGASAALSRMIHGGLRYMENGEFRLVQHALEERNRLLRNAPHYVAPLPTVIPIFSIFSGVWGAMRRFFRLSDKPYKRGAMIIKLGLSLYDLFTFRDRTMPRHRFSGPFQTHFDWPDFNPDIACSATYYDAWITYPERLGLEMIRDLEEEHPNAHALNYMNVVGTEDSCVQIHDRVGGEYFSFKPKVVVNASGAWIDFTNGALSPSSDNKKTNLVGGTKGSHLIIKNQNLFDLLDGKMVYYENQEGRVCILFPYFGNVLIGSTDLKLDDPEGNRCEKFEQDYILESLAYIFPDIRIRPEEIVYRFSGVRPLPRSDTSTTGQISRDHYCEMVSDKEGFAFPVLCMIGGKWTTFRAFGELAADQVLQLLGQVRKVSTKDLAIGGGKAFPAGPNEREAWVCDLCERFGLDRTSTNALIERYGTSAEQVISYICERGRQRLMHDDSYFVSEIEFIVEREYVEYAADILCRRTSIAIKGDMSLDLIDEVLAILGRLKGWPPSQIQDERAELLHLLSHFHGISIDTLEKHKVA